MPDVRNEALPARSPAGNGAPLWEPCATLLSRALAFCVIAIYLPVYMAVAAAVLLTSPGPAFVRKAYRRNKGVGDVIFLYEFRTECWYTWRETPMGALLRRLDLHRLPRLANVLLGQVGIGEQVQPLGL